MYLVTYILCEIWYTNTEVKEMDFKHTATVILEWMQVNQVSKTKMAEMVGISEGLLRAILKGDRRITSDRLTKFAEVTNIPRATLLGLSEKELFAGYSVIPRGGTKLSVANKHQIQQVAMLLNAYETFK